jgi:hypothetical protein
MTSWRRAATAAGFRDLSDDGVWEVFTVAEGLRNREQGNGAAATPLNCPGQRPDRERPRASHF